MSQMCKAHRTVFVCNQDQRFTLKNTTIFVKVHKIIVSVHSYNLFNDLAISKNKFIRLILKGSTAFPATALQNFPIKWKWWSIHLFIQVAKSVWRLLVGQSSYNQYLECIRHAVILHRCVLSSLTLEAFGLLEVLVPSAKLMTLGSWDICIVSAIYNRRYHTLKQRGKDNRNSLHFLSSCYGRLGCLSCSHIWY